MTNHTPEPWTAVKAKRPDNTGGYDYAIADSDDNIIAEVFQNVGYADKEKKIYNQRPAKANAHLIAASPKLFNAVKKALWHVNKDHPFFSELHELIAGIEGVSMEEYAGNPDYPYKEGKALVKAVNKMNEAIAKTEEKLK